jgi:hypothetical protein
MIFPSTLHCLCVRKELVRAMPLHCVLLHLLLLRSDLVCLGLWSSHLDSKLFARCHQRSSFVTFPSHVQDFSNFRLIRENCPSMFC